MKSTKQKIMTIDAKNLFKYYRKKSGETDKPFFFNTKRKSYYSAVVKQENRMEPCPLFDQFLMVLDEEQSVEKLTENQKEERLFDKLVIIDFDDIFLPSEKENQHDWFRRRKEGERGNVKDLMEKGLDICFEDHIAHMVPFDKSGNMGRNGRITFIDEAYLEPMNERLNLGMDFSDIKVVLSKYYAYRGLYLSTSNKVVNKNVKYTPETLIIIKDNRTKIIQRGPRKGEEAPINGLSYERDVPIETAEEDEDIPGLWKFKKPENRELAKVNMPFDGEGIITPLYSQYINDSLEMEGATSYQIRLPFAKGMLHEVDVHQFLDEFTKNGPKGEEYWYEDAFGIQRDLKKAHILLTESMFKGQAWLWEHCKKNGIDDPMEYYCNKINHYHHALYISGTNLPYGHSEYTHLSYQAINTLNFTEEQFKNVVKKHCEFIDDPKTFLQGWNEPKDEDDEENEEERKEQCFLPNWQRAVLKNPLFEQDIYIKEQLHNTQKGLLTKLALGKLVVKGQTRYLCRDLMPLLAALLNNPKDINDMYPKYLYKRFYMPMEEGAESELLDYSENYAFFRNPHLSRNEQCLLKPFTDTEEKYFIKRKNVSYKIHRNYLNIYYRYFGHLTGVVMVPRGSHAPLCLGGADFDGDLVSIIFDRDIIRAVESGVYSDAKRLERKLSVVEIPETKSKLEKVPAVVPYQHIFDTFYNRIGQISNAAICIGQAEYGLGNEMPYSSEGLSCAKCTLLTGLEIDAAKNGVHPNLDIILNNSIGRCSYLEFLRQFKKLKAEKKFRLENISIKPKSATIENEKYELLEMKATGCKTKAIFVLQNEGTYINRLPLLFVEQLKQYKKTKKASKEQVENKQITAIFSYNQTEELQQEQIARFKEECQAIFNIHFFYKNMLIKNLRNEKSKGFFAFENIENTVFQMYDEDNAEKILDEVLPVLQEKLEPYVNDCTNQRINKYQWQFQPRTRRRETLEQILDHNFDADFLTEKEEEILFHFHQQGYKMLWFLTEAIKGPGLEDFDVMKGRLAEQREKWVSKELKSLDTVLEEESKRYYEENASEPELAVYRYCLEEIRALIAETKLQNATKVKALYELTGIFRDSTNRKFFWEAFYWQDLQPFVEKEGTLC